MRTLRQIFQTEYEPTPEEYVDWVMQFKLDFKLFCERVLEYSVQDFHMEWIRAIMAEDRVSIIAPTGFGKTTFLGNAYILWRTFYEKDKRFLMISNSMPQSIRILEEIRILIENNEFLKELMPDNTLKTTSWTKTEIMTNTGCKIMCKPYNENIRGYHVDYILCDEAATFADHSIFFRYVVTRVTARNGKIAVISTPCDIADLMAILSHNPAWCSRRYKAIYQNERGERTLLWGSKFTNKKLASIRNEIGSAAFEREYLCNPKAMSENAIFDPGQIEDSYDYEMTFGSRLAQDSQVYLGCDFAIAHGPKADFDSYVIVERVGDKAVIRHGEVHKGFSIQAKLMRIEQLYQQYNVTRIIVDPSHVGYAVVEELRKRMLPFDAPDFSSQNRAKMLISLIQLFEQGRMIIPRNNKNPMTLTWTNRLINELLSFVETRTKSNFVTYQSTGAHDDTVMSLVLACRPVSTQKEFLDFVAI